MATFHPTSFSSASVSPITTPLLRLPDVLLPHVYSYLSPRELLVTLAQSAKTTRERLTPACFSLHSIVLGPNELSGLSSFASSSSLTPHPFHSRILSDCHLFVQLGSDSDNIDMQHLLDSLRYFPTCRKLTLNGRSVRRLLSDPQLHAILHLPTTLCCSELCLDGFERIEAAKVDVGGEQKQSEVEMRVTRSKRKRISVEVDRLPNFNWAHVRLPSLLRLSFNISGESTYFGGAAFLTAHTALLELHINEVLVSIADLTAVFQDSTALPLLTRLTLYETTSRPKNAQNIAPLLAALATTVMGVNGCVRPMEQLTLNISASNEVFAVAALMSGLTHLHVNSVPPGWLEEWSRTDMSCAFPLLRHCVVLTNECDERIDEQAGGRDMLPFLQSTANSLQHLRLCTGEKVTINAAAMSQLARFSRLEELDLCIGSDAESVWLDWTDPALFASFTFNCLPCLRSVLLEPVRLSAEAV